MKFKVVISPEVKTLSVRLCFQNLNGKAAKARYDMEEKQNIRDDWALV